MLLTWHHSQVQYWVISGMLLIWAQLTQLFLLLLKSDVNQNFSLLCNNDEEYAGYVKYLACQKVIKHDIHSSGTSYLCSHVASHGATVSSRDNDSSQCKFISYATQKKELSSTLSYSCTANLRPFSTVDEIGFQKLAQQFITLPFNISTEMYQLVQFCHQGWQLRGPEVTAQCKLLIKIVNQYIWQHDMLGVSTGMRQNGYKKKNYVSVMPANQIQYAGSTSYGANMVNTGVVHREATVSQYACQWCNHLLLYC